MMRPAGGLVAGKETEMDYEIDTDKLLEIITKTGMSQENVEDWLYTDWNNWDEHVDWLNSASADEIAGWIIAGS